MTTKELVLELEKIDAEIKAVNELHRKLYARRKQLQLECKHWETKRVYDASGNNDTNDVCTICEKEV